MYLRNIYETGTLNMFNTNNNKNILFIKSEIQFLLNEIINMTINFRILYQKYQRIQIYFTYKTIKSVKILLFYGVF